MIVPAWGLSLGSPGGSLLLNIQHLSASLSGLLDITLQFPIQKSGHAFS